MTRHARPTRVTVDLAAVANNVRLLRARTSQDTRLMAVVKADAYGHGAAAVARVALKGGAQALGVAIAEEGAQLREAGIKAPILVLGGATREGAALAVAYDLAQTVFDTRTMRWLAEAAGKAGRRADVHIKADTGMGRIGVRDAGALRALAEAIQAEPSLRLRGVFTHFAAADDGDLSFTREQLARYLSLLSALEGGGASLLRHTANSAATLRLPQAHCDMVRAGIALYVRPLLPDTDTSGFRQAMRWTTRGVHLKEIAPGETVSYGRIFRAEAATRVMTLPVGYADGYHRAIGGRGCALVRGLRAPVIGRVCMDQAMIDVTDVPGASLEDEVVLLGAQGNDAISAAEMGSWCGMIDYEVVLSPTGRVPREYVGEDA